MIRNGVIETDKYKGAYRTVFDFHKRWNPCPRGPEEWDAAAVEMQEISIQHGDDLFLADMLIAVFAEMERNAKI